MIKIRKTTPWSADEVLKLKECYSEYTAQELLKLFPHRSIKAIHNKARRLGLYKTEDAISRTGLQSQMTGFKDEFSHINEKDLRKMYEIERKSAREIGEIYNCSFHVILKRLKWYGISTRKCPSEYTPEERKEKWGRPLDKHSLWRGGITPINDLLRNATNEWRYESMKEHNFRCFITGEETHDLHVHHVKPFFEIRDESISELGLDKRKQVSDYTPEDIEAIKTLITEKHEREKGYPITSEIHQLFHKLYGHKTTEADLFEFKQRYQSGEFGVKEAIA